ncbi:MAG: hypothetical protein ACP5MI_04740 [Candidatus Kryptoniota bacterium]
MALRKPFEQSYFPPIPTKFTKFLRTNLIYQFFRFIVINVKMLIMVRKH